MPKEDTQFKKGVSGNPGGRPKNPLKEFQREVFASMTTEEKVKFLEKVGELDRWKMAEGNPDSNTDITTKGEAIKVTPEALAIAKKYEEELNKLEDGNKNI